jgi:hypothetical protein
MLQRQQLRLVKKQQLKLPKRQKSMPLLVLIKLKKSSMNM